MSARSRAAPWFRVAPALAELPGGRNTPPFWCAPEEEALVAATLRRLEAMLESRRWHDEIASA